MSHDILDSGSGTDTCGRCGQAKEPTRFKSMTCRACDALSRSKRAPRTSHKPVTASLPLDVWGRLDSDAKALGISIGTHVQRMLVKHDGKMNEKYPERNPGATP